MCVVSGCVMAAAQGVRAAFQKVALQNCLVMSGFKFCSSRAVQQQWQNAVAVLERTEEDSISCVLMRGGLSPLPSIALMGRTLPWCSICLQGCRSLSVLLVIKFVAWLPPPFTTANVVQQLLCLLQVGKGDFCTSCNRYCGTSSVLSFSEGLYKWTRQHCFPATTLIEARLLQSELSLSWWHFLWASKNKVCVCGLADV